MPTKQRDWSHEVLETHGIKIPDSIWNSRKIARYLKEGIGIGSGRDDRADILLRLSSLYVGKYARRYVFNYDAAKTTSYKDDVMIKEVVPHSLHDCVQMKKTGILQKETDYFSAIIKLKNGRSSRVERLTLLELI